MPKTQLIYKLYGINPEDGIDVFEIAPILMSFGELIQSANDVLGSDQKIDVKVKPFREGSWITDFVLHSKPMTELLNYFNSEDGNNLLIILQLLGLDAKETITGVSNIIRFTKGKVNNFRKNDDETITYENDNGEKITVTLPEHKLVQSPLVQVNYYKSVVSPLEKFPTAETVSIRVNQEGHEEQKFSGDDKFYFSKYAEAELLEDLEENITTMSSVFLKPKRGSYSGEEKAYSFYMGESVLWPVTIEDEDFLAKMRNGEIRPYSEDVLKANLEIRQKRDAKNEILVSYAITKVVDYIKYEKPKQLKLNNPN